MRIESIDDMKKVDEIILNLDPEYVLIKGSHLKDDCVDVLMGKDILEIFQGERINRKNTHAT